MVHSGPSLSPVCVYETSSHRLAARKYKETVRGIKRGESFIAPRYPDRVVKGEAITMMYNGKVHSITVYGTLQKGEGGHSK